MAEQGNNKVKKWLRIIFLLLPFIRAFNFILPFVIKAVINRQLKKLNGFWGSIDKLEISGNIIRVKKLHFDTVNELSGTHTVMITIDVVEFGYEYRELWHGILACDISIETPVFNFAKSELLMQSGESKINMKGAGSVMGLPLPLIVSQAKVTNGSFTYSDSGTSPSINVSVTNIAVNVSRFANFKMTEQILPTCIDVSAVVAGGNIKSKIGIDVFNQAPTFDLNLKAENLNLTALSSLFEAYGKIAVLEGNLEIYTEVAARESKFKGYVKPLIQNLKLAGNEEDASFLSKLRTGIIQTVSKILENPEEEQLGTKIPFEGTFQNPEVGIFFAVLETLRNAFISALQPNIDNEIDINSVKK